MDSLSLSPEALAALQGVAGMDGAVDMETLLMQMRVANRCDDESSSSEEDDDNDDGNREPVDYKAYYAKLHGDSHFAQADAEKPPLPKVACVKVEDAYVQDLLERLFNARPEWKCVSTLDEPAGFRWVEYEDIAWDSPEFANEDYVVSCYYTRKGLIRKALLARTIEKWVTKYPYSVLKASVPQTFVLEAKDVVNSESLRRYLEDACFPGFGHAEEPPTTWILKPSVTNQALGIELVQSVDQLQRVVEDAPELHREGGYVLQRYLANPLLHEGRKFHLRVYVLVTGNFKAYVYPEFLALFASSKYSNSDTTAKHAHLTNTCFQQTVDDDSFDESAVVKLFSELVHEMLPNATAEERQAKCTQVRRAIVDVVGETFKAVSRELTFQTRANCFEMFGFDFLLDQAWNCWLLEANAEPDFKQTGKRLQHIIASLIEEVLALTIDQNPRFGEQGSKGTDGEQGSKGADGEQLAFELAYEEAPRPW